MGFLDRFIHKNNKKQIANKLKPVDNIGSYDIRLDQEALVKESFSIIKSKHPELAFDDKFKIKGHEHADFLNHEMHHLICEGYLNRALDAAEEIIINYGMCIKSRTSIITFLNLLYDDGQFNRAYQCASKCESLYPYALAEIYKFRSKLLINDRNYNEALSQMLFYIAIKTLTNDRLANEYKDDVSQILKEISSMDKYNDIMKLLQYYTQSKVLDLEMIRRDIDMLFY